MKLNPFSKKSNPYLDKIKAEHDALNLELTPLKAELAEAEAEHSAAREKQTRLCDAAGSLSMNTPPAAKAHWPILCEANQRMERLKSKVSNLEGRLRPLQQVLATPERFALARKQCGTTQGAHRRSADGRWPTDQDRQATDGPRSGCGSRTYSRGGCMIQATTILTCAVTRASQAELERQRDAVQAQLGGHHHDESRFPVEIPRALIEVAGDALAAEMPAP